MNTDAANWCSVGYNEGKGPEERVMVLFSSVDNNSRCENVVEAVGDEISN